MAWLYGHTRYASSFDYGSVSVRTNQLGYIREESQISFNPYAYLDLNAQKLKYDIPNNTHVTQDEFDAL